MVGSGSEGRTERTWARWRRGISRNKANRLCGFPEQSKTLRDCHRGRYDYSALSIGLRERILMAARHGARAMNATRYLPFAGRLLICVPFALVLALFGFATAVSFH
jgi:hypothetical protein